MTCAIVLFTIWVGILIGGGAALNYAASITNISAITTGMGIVILIIQIIGVLIGLFFVLLYSWSVKKSNQLESYLRKKKCNTKKCIKKKKQQIINSKNETKNKIKTWYNNQWFAIENESE